MDISKGDEDDDNNVDPGEVAEKPDEVKKSKKKKKKKRKRVREGEAATDQNGDILQHDASPLSKRRKLQSQSPEESMAPTEHAASTNGVPANQQQVAKSDDDDDDLLAAAAQWADNEEKVTGKTEMDPTNKKKDRKQQGNEPAHQDIDEAASVLQQPPPTLSLHITQLPFDSSEMDLRKFFAQHGCQCTSIRLVYDRDVQGRKTVFRGVAFVDLADVESYNTALKLNHKASIRSRKLNIRPTRSKQELADIVTKTREIVQEKIRRQRTGETSADVSSKPRKDMSKSKSSSQKKPKVPPQNDDGTPRKLTKKERNRKAAIIMGLKRRGQQQKRR